MKVIELIEHLQKHHPTATVVTGNTVSKGYWNIEDVDYGPTSGIVVLHNTTLWADMDHIRTSLR